MAQKFENNLKAMCSAFQRYFDRAYLAESFSTLKIAKTRKTVEEKVKQKQIKKFTEVQQELVQTIKKIETIGHKVEDIDLEMTAARKKMQESQKYVIELEERDVHLNNEYISLLEK